MRYLYIKTRSVSHNILLVLLLLIVTAFMTVAGLLFIVSALAVQSAFSHCMTAFGFHLSDFFGIKL